MVKVIKQVFFHSCALTFWVILLISCSGTTEKSPNQTLHQALQNPIPSVPQMIILGIAQDAGYPQIDCQKFCCAAVWKDKSQRKMVSCLGLRDPLSNQVWLFDATPDFKDQRRILKDEDDSTYKLGGIFLTHAHMGHYTGLIHLGREALGANQVLVFTMPKMKTFLETNGPWE
ncbi:MAG: pyrroloquinoline quinone biosynthesis protein B [Saprospiraceae bacterium]|jgi:pyrroloquinoline quinone biosynthesis protein B